jgi:imidazolonepropionase
MYIIKNAEQVVTCSGFNAKKGKEMSELHIINNGAVVIENDKIIDLGNSEDILNKYAEKKYEIIDAKNKIVLPGFVDSHTHFVFGGYREDEFNWRLKGMPYMEIMKKGGGILRSVTATRNASEDELYSNALKRLDNMIRLGITTVEGKSGYGLDKDTELKQLKVMKNLNENHPVDIISTFMGAHAVLSEYKGKEDEFIDFMIKEVLPEVKKENLAEFCDIFCEEGVFSVETSKKMLSAAKEIGLKLKIHADEIIQLGGAELAAQLNAVSADHLLQASDEGIKQMAENNVVATLLPGTAFSLKEDYARARYMIDNNCAVALATDLNPGSCFSQSIPLIISLAALNMKMTTEEIITALTINGAAAVDKAQEIGSIDKGKKADIIIIDAPSYEFLTYHFGMNLVETVIKNGKLVFKREEIKYV